jgi:hypothetical protein
MTTPQRRDSDQLVAPMFYAGILCILIGAGLAAAIILTKGTFTTPAVIVISVFAGGGLLLMPTHRVISAIRFWRRGNGDRPSGSSGATG